MTDPSPEASARFALFAQADRVVRCRSARLVVAAGGWDYARDRADSIDTHWQQRLRQSPAMFNGVIHLMRTATLEQGAFAGGFVRTDFKSYLHWRERGFPEAGVRDGFGSALIRSVEGHVVLGRQRAGNINAGLAYLPGGFIDSRDVGADGTIDIDGSILRELGEETGLQPGDLEMQPDYILTLHGPLLSFAREFRSVLGAEAVRARILAHIADDPKSELTDAVIVRSATEIESGALAPYARQLLGWLLA